MQYNTNIYIKKSFQFLVWDQYGSLISSFDTDIKLFDDYIVSKRQKINRNDTLNTYTNSLPINTSNLQLIGIVLRKSSFSFCNSYNWKAWILNKCLFILGMAQVTAEFRPQVQLPHIQSPTYNKYQINRHPWHNFNFSFWSLTQAQK